MEIFLFEESGPWAILKIYRVRYLFSRIKNEFFLVKLHEKEYC